MRIGIANDMPLAVEALRRAIAHKREHRIVWVASDGFDAVACCARETPDVVLMDLIMPRLGGVEATRRIMAATPCAILIVTVGVGANVGLVYEAMGNGALDAVDTPQLPSASDENSLPLLAKLDTIRKLIGDGSGTSARDDSESRALPSPDEWLIVIGASAGGPSALAVVLSGLPKNFDAAVVVIQHVDERFAPGMAAWLDRVSPLTVRVALEGDRPTRGTVLLAATNDHLKLTASARLGYSRDPIGNVYRPSVDVFFRSVARFWTGKTAGILLTGMGRDGAAGLKELRDDGRHTIAQDRASSAVYGMPKAALALGAACETLPLEHIAPRLLELVDARAFLGVT